MPNCASLLRLVMIVGSCVGAVAQSGPLLVPPPLPAPYQPAHDSRTQLPQVGRGSQLLGSIPRLQNLRSPMVAKVVIPTAPSSQVCYTMRSYNFVQDGESPDAIRLRDFSTCEPAAKIRRKSIQASKPR